MRADTFAELNFQQQSTTTARFRLNCLHSKRNIRIGNWKEEEEEEASRKLPDAWDNGHWCVLTLRAYMLSLTLKMLMWEIKTDIELYQNIHTHTQKCFKREQAIAYSVKLINLSE